MSEIFSACDQKRLFSEIHIENRIHDFSNLTVFGISIAKDYGIDLKPGSKDLRFLEKGMCDVN